MRANGVKPNPRPELPEPMPIPGCPLVLPPALGAIYASRKVADATVEMLASVGLISEVVPDGRYFRVKVYPRQPEGRH